MAGTGAGEEGADEVWLGAAQRRQRTPRITFRRHCPSDRDGLVSEWSTMAGGLSGRGAPSRAAPARAIPPSAPATFCTWPPKIEDSLVRLSELKPFFIIQSLATKQGNSLIPLSPTSGQCNGERR